MHLLRLLTAMSPAVRLIISLAATVADSSTKTAAKSDAFIAKQQVFFFPADMPWGEVKKKVLISMATNDTKIHPKAQ